MLSHSVRSRIVVFTLIVHVSCFYYIIVESEKILLQFHATEHFFHFVFYYFCLVSPIQI